MLDYDNYDAVFNKGDSGDDYNLRRSKLTLYHYFDENWQGKIQLSYNDKKNKFEEKDINLTYNGWKFADIRLGKFKQPYGLEYSTSSKNLLAIERSMATNAFSLGRSYGIGLSSHHKKSTWAVGLFDATNEEDVFSDYAITGRFTHLAYQSEQQLIHIGMSGSWRKAQEKKHQINVNMEVYNAKKVVESPKLPVKYIGQYGVEAIWQYQSFLLQSEIFKQHVSVKSNFPTQDAQYNGYYIQASYLLTGEKHRYKKGRFVSLKPENNYGAWEIVARYSDLNAHDNNDGRQAKNTMLGLNYYANKKIRLMFNYIHGQLSDDELFATDSGEAFSARIQYVF